MGASLALQGAHALATALEQHADVPAALSAYEQTITPIARGYHLSARALRPFLLSRSHLLGVVRNALVKHTPQWVAQSEAKRFYRTQSSGL
jgi:2-polyprenyl-6-methoxyphenol hydroxylase-like FAD-dependent oxidoreductase